MDGDSYSRGYNEGYRDAMKAAAECLRETSKKEIEDKPGDLAYPLGAVGRWMRQLAERFEQLASHASERLTK